MADSRDIVLDPLLFQIFYSGLRNDTDIVGNRPSSEQTTKDITISTPVNTCEISYSAALDAYRQLSALDRSDGAADGQILFSALPESLKNRPVRLRVKECQESPHFTKLLDFFSNKTLALDDVSGELHPLEQYPDSLVSNC